VSVGSPANLVIFDPEATWTAGDFVSRSSNSPFSGRQLKGKVVATISNGIVVYREKA
jgi:dihydroorotase